ncbi:hypothetical protein [Chryseobacterium indoltheticum]|uniref:hypothetical protein n=1 Tax=Chryseobacterium indoltheticum TaxID=254 RepID=UPI003F49AFB7
MKIFQIVLTGILICFLISSSFAQNKKLILSNNYYKINKMQKDILEFYLLARFYYPYGKIRSFNKIYVLTPELIAIDKKGRILDFDSYKIEYKKSSEYKKIFQLIYFIWILFEIQKMMN